jgi:hypothetical protein
MEPIRADRPVSDNCKEGIDRAARDGRPPGRKSSDWAVHLCPRTCTCRSRERDSLAISFVPRTRLSKISKRKDLVNGLMPGHTRSEI